MSENPAPALPPTVLTPRFSAALEDARTHHAGDLRKGTSIPFLAHLEDAPTEVQLVSAADTLHNTRSILADLRVHGEALWARFNRGGEAQLWYHGALRDVVLRRMPGPLADELDRTVRAINLQVGWEDRMAWLGVPTSFWSIGDLRHGGFVDWPGCPLLVELIDGELVVRGHVGSGGDHCPDADDDLDDIVSVDLGDLHLEYVEPDEQVWLLETDRGNLAETCARVAALVPALAVELQAEVGLEERIATFEGLEDRGPY